MTTEQLSLRERNAALARDAILDAAANRLTGGNPDDTTLADLAADAGVSLRTLYRYFPTRDDLLEAAGERLYARVGLRDEIDDDESVSASFLAASDRLSGQIDLARNLIRTTVGREIRSPRRRQRVREVQTAVARAARNDADPAAIALAGSAVAYLCNSASWVTICDESDMNPEQARVAVAWAIDSLVDAIRDGRLPEPPVK